MPKPLNQAIKHLRGHRTQEQFANAIGVTRNTIYMWETGKFAPHVTQLQSLVRDGLDVIYLTGEDQRDTKRGGEAA